MIDSVEVDRREVCRGESVLVRVAARATDGAPQFLAVGAAERPELSGPEFPLALQETLAEGALRVFARGKRGLAAFAYVPSVTVKDCDPKVRLEIHPRRNVAMPDRAWLTAAITTSPDAPAFSAVRYEWDFGDGRREVTTQPELMHSYEARIQETAYSYFVVKATAFDGSGNAVKGVASLRFVNMGFDASGQGRVLLGAGIDANASGGEAIWLYHGSPRPVRLTRVTVRERVSDDAGSDRELSEKTYDARALFGFDEVDSGQSRALPPLAELRPTQPGHSTLVELMGTTAEGGEASGAFDLLPPPQPVAATPGTREGEE